MTTTPPEAPGQGPSPEPDPQHQSRRDDPSGATHGGPRVDAAQMMDLHRLRRTTGPASRVAGVAGGIARHLDVDPLLIRVLFVVLAIFGGAGLLLYVACWLLVPEDGQDRAPLGLGEQGRIAALVVAGVLFLLVLFGGVFGRDVFWPVLLGAGVVAAVLLAQGGGRPAGQPGRVDSRAGATGPGAAAPTGAPGAPSPVGGPDDRADTSWDDGSAVGSEGGWDGSVPPYAPPAWTPPPPPPPDPRRRGPVLFWGVMAAVLLGWGVLGVVDVAGTALPFSAYPALALATIGAGLVLGAFWGRAGGLVAIGLLTIPVLAATTAADEWEGSEDRTVVPVTVTGIPDRIEHGAGTLTVDLTRVDPEDLDGRTVRVSQGVGELTVVVPEEMDTEVSADVGLGGLEVFGSTRGGPGLSTTQTDEGTEDLDLTLDLELGLGEMSVIREGAR